jgi:hypothetical protein
VRKRYAACVLRLAGTVARTIRGAPGERDAERRDERAGSRALVAHPLDG